MGEHCRHRVAQADAEAHAAALTAQGWFEQDRRPMPDGTVIFTWGREPARAPGVSPTDVARESAIRGRQQSADGAEVPSSGAFNDDLPGVDELRARGTQARQADTQRAAREAEHKATRHAEIARLLESFFRRAVQLDLAPRQVDGRSRRVRDSSEGENWQITHETIAVLAFPLFSGYWSETASALSKYGFFTPGGLPSGTLSSDYWISGPPYSMEIVAHEARWRRPSRRERREIARHSHHYLINDMLKETRARAPRVLALTSCVMIIHGKVEEGYSNIVDIVQVLDSVLDAVPSLDGVGPPTFQRVDLSLLRQYLEEELVRRIR